MTNDETELEMQRRHSAIGRVATGVVHESRNILTGALSFAQLGKRRTTDDESREFFTRIETELRRVLEIFGHSLDIARGDSQTPTTMTEVALEAPLRSVRALVREQASLARVKIETAIPDPLPSVVASERYVVQILLNLCINAVQASPPGGVVRIRVAHHGQWVDVQVSDGGGGVPEDSRDKIFEPFYTTKGEAGTGLGLSESQKKARAMGGDLSLEPSDGTGATFKLRLRVVDA